MKRLLGCIFIIAIIFIPSFLFSAPFQVVKWPKSSQLKLLDAYKIVIENSSGNIMQEIIVKYDDAAVGWIKDGLILFKQPQDGSGTPVKVVCDYGELNLPAGEYISRVIACNSSNICSDISDAPKVVLKKDIQSETSIIRYADDTYGRKLIQTITWVTKIEFP